MGLLPPFLLGGPLTEIVLRGGRKNSLDLAARLRDLTCMSEMVGGPVFVFEIKTNLNLDPPPISARAVDFRGGGADIIDTWGPGMLIAEPGDPYGEQLYGIEIAGGVIRPSDYGIFSLAPVSASL